MHDIGRGAWHDTVPRVRDMIGLAVVSPSRRPSVAQDTERAFGRSIELAATLDEAGTPWAAREGITSFFAPDARIEPRAGRKVQVCTDPRAESGMKAPTTCASRPCS